MISELLESGKPWGGSGFKKQWYWIWLRKNQCV